MAYCPEDGAKMRYTYEGIDWCYDCPKCNMHWYYNGERGSYDMVIDAECVKCGEWFGTTDLAVLAALQNLQWGEEE